VASYPKSGNTWMRMWLTSYFRPGRVVELNRLAIPSIADVSWFDRYSVVPPSELSAAELWCLRPDLHRGVAAEATAQTAFKVHDAFGVTPEGDLLFPPEVSRLVVYLVRHPGDVALSLAAHLGITVDQAVEFMGASGAVLGERSRTQLPQVVDSWSRHVDGWTRQTHIPVVVVRYEDMLDNPHAAFHHVLTALGESVDERRVQDCVEQARFERVRQVEAESGFVEKPVTATAAFFRTGRSGNWRTQMPAALLNRIADTHAAAMARFGYDPDEMHR
jgi:hypothetical protein